MSQLGSLGSLVPVLRTCSWCLKYSRRQASGPESANISSFWDSSKERTPCAELLKPYSLSILAERPQAFSAHRRLQSGHSSMRSLSLPAVFTTSLNLFHQIYPVVSSLTGRPGDGECKTSVPSFAFDALSHDLDTKDISRHESRNRSAIINEDTQRYEMNHSGWRDTPCTCSRAGFLSAIIGETCLCQFETTSHDP